MSKTILMTTVAAAAVAGFATIAAAQTPAGGEPGKGTTSQGVQHEQKATPGGGAAMHQPGAQSNGKMDQGQMDQGRSAAQDEQHGEHTMQQRGAEDETGKQQRGAQGTQDEQHGKSSVNAANRGGGERGGSVELSQDQRTKIQTIIGSHSGARVTTNVNFDISVGARVPRNVHIEVLPRDVVEIVPQYEGFDYVVVGDQILIIDPASLEIVAVLPA
jgi:Protein of unknown function (DUF1236)